METDGSGHPRMTRRGAIAVAAAVPAALAGTATGRSAPRGEAAAWTTSLDTNESLQEVTASGSLVLARTSSALFGVDAANGETRFVRPVPEGFQWLSHRHGRPYLFADGVGHALSPADGRDRWTVDLPWDGYPHATVTPDALYVGVSDVVALAHADGAELWRTDDGQPGRPVVVNDGVLATSGAPSNPGAGYDTATGERRYDVSATDAPREYGPVGPYYVGVGAEDTRIWDAATGRSLGATPERFEFLDAVGGAFFGFDGDGIHRISTDDWSVEWTATDEMPTLLVGVQDDVAYVTRQSDVLALGLDGTVRWTYGDATYPDLVPASDGAFYRDASHLVRLGADGTERWTVTSPVPAGSQTYALTAYAADYVVAGERGPTLRAYAGSFDAPAVDESWVKTPTPTTTTAGTTRTTPSQSTTAPTTTTPTGSGGGVPGFGTAAALLSLGAATAYSFLSDCE